MAWASPALEAGYAPSAVRGVVPEFDPIVTMAPRPLSRIALATICVAITVAVKLMSMMDRTSSGSVSSNRDGDSTPAAFTK